jgi:DNA-binding transcriptional MerR regulator
MHGLYKEKGADMADQTPLYNLKAVTNEVGLNPATLRAWERRYGLLKPKRTPGGHRLYSRQDIEMLKWLVERQKEGEHLGQWAVGSQRPEEGETITSATP